MHGKYRRARACQLREAIAGARVRGIVVIVAHPGFENVAEQVERVRVTRGAFEKCQEGVDGPGGLAVEMEV